MIFTITYYFVTIVQIVRVKLYGVKRSIREAILENKDISSDPILGKHHAFSLEIKKKYKNITKDTVEEILRAEVGKVFLEVLRDAGIFKEDEAGKEGFRRFIASLS